MFNVGSLSRLDRFVIRDVIFRLVLFCGCDGVPSSCIVIFRDGLARFVSLSFRLLVMLMAEVTEISPVPVIAERLVMT